MPNVKDMIRNHFIDSEEDIPEEYRKIIEEKLSHPEKEKITLNEIIPGLRGKIISQEEELQELFKDKNKIYFGHGTPGGEETVNSILEIGLKVKDPKDVKGYMDTLRGLSSTTIEFGPGTEDMFDKKKAIRLRKSREERNEIQKIEEEEEEVKEKEGWSIDDDW